jgi:hypothetical protein
VIDEEDSQMTKKILTVVALGLLASTAANANHRGGNWNQPSTPFRFNAPEIDPASAGSALTLLLSGLAVVRSRISRRK